MISIDPGVNYYAAASWRSDGTLFDAVLLPLDIQTPSDLYVMERPRIRRYGMHRAPSETIIALTLSAGRLSDRAPTVWVDAGVWTKGRNKKQRQPQVWESLTAAEQHILMGRTKKDLDHLLDAIGIGLHYLDTKGIRTCSR